MKLHFVGNPSEAIIALKRDETIADWGLKEAGSRTVTRPNAAGVVNLFGEAPVSILTLESTAEIKLAVADLEAMESTSSKLEHGLVILTAQPAASTKKLQAAVKALGGTVDAATKSGAAASGPELVEPLAIKKELKDFLVDWAGQEPSQLVSIVRAISAIPAERQAKLTMEDILIRLPIPPGSIPPWEIEKPLFAGDLNGTIKTFRRIVSTSAPILVQFVLYKKFHSLYGVASLIENDPSISNDEISKVMGFAGRQVNFFKPTAKRYGSTKLEMCVKIFEVLEEELKTGVSNPDARYEVALVRVLNILRS